MTTALGSEQWAVIGVVDPDANGAAEYLTAAIDMSMWSRIVAVVQTGTLGTSATVDLKLTDSDATGGTYTDISGKAITQLVKASNDDDQAVINLRFDELNTDARFVKAAVTVGTATSDCSAIVMGLPRYYPASDNDIASVVEIVN